MPSIACSPLSHKTTAAPNVPPPSVSRDQPTTTRYAAAGADNLFSLAINRDFRRAALFGWITPLLATRSSVLMASNTAADAASPPPSVIAASALRTEVLAAVRNGLFRRRRRSDTRIRFFADLLFAKAVYPSLRTQLKINTKRSAVSTLSPRSYQKAPGGSRIAVRWPTSGARRRQPVHISSHPQATRSAPLPALYHRRRPSSPRSVPRRDQENAPLSYQGRHSSRRGRPACQ